MCLTVMYTVIFVLIILVLHLVGRENKHESAIIESSKYNLSYCQHTRRQWISFKAPEQVHLYSWSWKQWLHRQLLLSVLPYKTHLHSRAICGNSYSTIFSAIKGFSSVFFWFEINPNPILYYNFSFQLNMFLNLILNTIIQVWVEWIGYDE